MEVNLNLDTVVSEIPEDKGPPPLPFQSNLMPSQNHLNKIFIFSKFAPEELSELIRLGTLERYPANTNIVIEGEKSRGLYVILNGKLSVHRNNPSTGKMHRIAFLEENGWFGELSLVDDGPRVATVIADTDVALFHLEANLFLNYLEKRGDSIKARFFEACAQELVTRFKKQNEDYIHSQHLLWQHALSKPKESA